MSEFADKRVSRLLSPENDAERKRKLEIRMVGLTRAVGEAEPGEREFCLAAIDEWLDYMIDLQDRYEECRRLSASKGQVIEALERKLLGEANDGC